MSTALRAWSSLMRGSAPAGRQQRSLDDAPASSREGLRCLDGRFPISLRSIMEYSHLMKRIALAAVFAVLSTAAPAQQSFVTVRPEPKTEAWWLRAEFHPMHSEVRGIPVAQIRRNWCKATEYTRELFPNELLVEDGKDSLKEYGLAFSVTGNFDRSKTSQVALVGVYQTCAGQKGSFLLVIDEDTKRIRFVDATPGKTQFAVLAADRGAIVLMHCMECDDAATLRWNAKKKAFGWVR